MLRYFLKINVTSSSLSMHVNIATRIAAERSLSLLTRTNKAFGTYRQTDFGELHIHDTQLSFLSLPYTVMTTSLLAQVSRKTFLSLRS